jgi:outer membrane murein-binding lipoprotein Lpp
VTQEREPVTATETADDPGESLAAALAAELRAGSVAEDDLELLGEAVVDAHPALGSGSVVARLDQLQGDVVELRSYTGALETFLDENGTGEQLVESVQAELDSVDSRLDSLETEVEQLRSDLTDEIEQQGPGSAEFDELNSRIERVDQELEQLKDWRQRLVETLGD